MTYTVRPSKGDFLLYTVMNIAGYHENNECPVVHPLRLQTRAHFAKEINNPIVFRFYDRFRAHDSYGFARDAVQRTELGLEIDPEGRGAQALRLIEQFRASTDFDEFYASVLPQYEGACLEVREQIGRFGLAQVLDCAWEHTSPYEHILIPRPLEAPWCGHGPHFGRYALALFGPDKDGDRLTFNASNTRHLVGHEFSHSYAKLLIDELAAALQARGTVHEIERFGKQQRARGYSGPIVLEETMIRAMQARYIDPFLESPFSVDDRLARERKGGFEHIYAFDNAIREHKENPSGSLAEAMADLVEQLAGAR